MNNDFCAAHLFEGGFKCKAKFTIEDNLMQLTKSEVNTKILCISCKESASDAIEKIVKEELLDKVFLIEASVPCSCGKNKYSGTIVFVGFIKQPDGEIRNDEDFDYDQFLSNLLLEARCEGCGKIAPFRIVDAIREKLPPFRDEKSK